MTGAAGVDVVVDLTKRAPADDPVEGAAVAGPDDPVPERRRVRPSRPARVVLAARRSAPATRARALVGVALLVVAAGAPLVARGSLDGARSDEGALRTAAGEVSDLRVDVAAAEGRATQAAQRAAADAAVAREARNAQRQRLAAIGLNESTIDAFLAAQLSNTELVEYRRDRTTSDVDRQAREIPTMEQCLERAKQSVNEGFNTQFGNAPPPGPDAMCRALLG